MQAAILIARRENVDLLLLQEVQWNVSVDYRDQQGWRVTVVSTAKARSKAGVAAVMSPRLAATVVEYTPHSERLLEIVFRTHVGPWFVWNGYAPTEPSDSAEKNAYWHMTSAAIRKRARSQPRCLAGDLNTRLHAKCDGENALGPWVPGRGLEFLQSPATGKENREHMLELCAEHEFIHCNSQFRYDYNKKYIYRDINAPLGCAKSAITHAELDHVLFDGFHRSFITNVVARQDILSHSHHCPLELWVAIRAKKPFPKLNEMPKWKRERFQDPEILKKFNNVL